MTSKSPKADGDRSCRDRDANASAEGVVGKFVEFTAGLDELTLADRATSRTWPGVRRPGFFVDGETSTTLHSRPG